MSTWAEQKGEGKDTCSAGPWVSDPRREQSAASQAAVLTSAQCSAPPRYLDADVGRRCHALHTPFCTQDGKRDLQLLM